MKILNKSAFSFFFFSVFKSKSLIFFLFLISFFLITSCGKDSTKPDTVTFSGTVTLDGQTDHSGVKVSLYKPVELDTALVRINQQYPNIGVQISQETEFDHRNNISAYSATTNTTGQWKIERVNEGKYNIVAEKDSFGWAYKFDLSAQGNIQFDLKKLIRLQNNGSIMSNEKYSIGENQTITTTQIEADLDNAELYLEPFGKLFLANLPANLNIHDIRIYAAETSEIHLTSTNTSLTLSNFNVNNLNKFVLDDFNSVDLSNICLSDVGSIVIQNIDQLAIENISINNVASTALQNDLNASFLRSVIYNNPNFGLDIRSSNMVMNNNMFLNNNRALYSRDANNLDVDKSNFEKNYEAIYLHNHFDGTISNCNFISNENDIKLRTQYGVPYPIISQNNFWQNQNFIIFLDHKSDSVSAQSNYWDTTNLGIIQQKIMDFYDNDQLGEVIFQPILLSPNPQAGIESNK